jgi:type II secretory pathway pseudopilin PulG
MIRLPRQIRATSSAFTLLELLVATICLAGASIGVLSALRFSNDRAVAAKYRLIATQYASTQIETAKGKALASTLTSGTTVQNLSNTGVPGALTVTTTTAAVGGTPDLYTVHVVASWNSGSSSVTFDTIVRYGDVG